MNTIYKNESFILFSCILIIIVFYLFYYICKNMYKVYKKYKIYNKDSENFASNNSNNSKRNRMINIYKTNNIADPDENPDENVNDPDSTFGSDPDS